MVYLFGGIGLVLGFVAGLVVINLFLKNYSKGELVGNKSLRWSYGLAVWVFAALGVWLGVWFYERSFF